MWDLWVGIALIICAVALLNHVKLRAGKGGLVKKQAEAFEARLGEVERRLGDIQEVVLSIDEKLDQQAKERK